MSHIRFTASCGAVYGAIDQAELGNLTAKLAKMDVNTDGVQGERSSRNTTLVESVTKTNIEQAVQDIQSRSSVLAHLV